MKVSVIAHKLTSPDFLELYQYICAFLRDQNLKVDSSYFDTTVDQDSGDLESAYKRNKKIIQDADFVVAETTVYSSGVGYLIAEALNLKKPVLALHNATKGIKPSNIIRSSTVSKLLAFESYTSLETLKTILTDYLSTVRSKLDIKFLFIIPPDLENYLQWYSKERKMHKSQVLRTAVYELMEKDPLWKKEKSTL